VRRKKGSRRRLPSQNSSELRALLERGRSQHLLEQKLVRMRTDDELHGAMILSVLMMQLP
jgi:hypothetical protein